ncbi:MAG: MotA/TolQ/ExbB proton channel family protein [Cytophagales bacterium]|jgi:biopolymer transport protein ExbB|nr:MotA/TolQ/ExbB proton channel family protein [Bacteroidota bacterium]MBS1982449.1 MotA/TolQ/ExbB proton channel family protein [Bacteroidota bacterium]WHZ06284.1 MAG: MotA/TolQ/ExbB proton channel family protein [Cytophagales bacterium]
MKTQSKSSSSSLSGSLKSTFTIAAIVIEIALAFAIYYLVLGDGSHFQGGDNHNHPVPGDYLGIIYKGGVLVPVLIALLMMVITFGIERFITISMASGKGSTQNFVHKIKGLVETNNVEQALSECDKQKGSVANVVKAGLHKYNELSKNTSIEVDKRIQLIQKDIEETTQLEMPMLQKNLVIIATIASIATLMGLLGTVLGMIKSFAALATAGAPDSVALANGISEALINTALGIGTSALAIILYNTFTSKIDALTYGIDEAGFSIVQNFTAQAKV